MISYTERLKNAKAKNSKIGKGLSPTWLIVIDQQTHNRLAYFYDRSDAVDYRTKNGGKLYRLMAKPAAAREQSRHPMILSNY